MARLPDTVPGASTSLCQHYLLSRRPPRRNWARAWVGEAGEAIGSRASVPALGPAGDKALPWESNGRHSSAWEPKEKAAKAGPGQGAGWTGQVAPRPEVCPSHRACCLPLCQAGDRRLSQKTVLLAELSWQ